MADIVNMPKLGFDMAEGVLVRWVIAEGESVEKGVVLAEIETDKATVEVESSQTGVVLKHIVEEGTPVPVGDPIAVVGEEGEDINLDDLVGEDGEPKPEKEDVSAEAVEEKTQEEIEQSPEGAQLPGGVRASPVARRMAEEKGIDLKEVNGSGPRGRIVKADIESYDEERALVEERIPEYEPTLIGEPREDRHVPLSGLRRRIGQRMQASMQTIPHFYVTYEYDMGELMDLRKKINRMLEDDGVKISVNDFIVKAVALTLVKFPNLNASLDQENNQILQHGQINVGIAVALDDGLITVVNRNTDRQTLQSISSDLEEKVTRARSGKVRSEDIEGSTFSVSNLGMFGVEHFTAIINPPEAAILAVGAVREMAVFEDGEFNRELRMKATISIDHRISDGAEAARFMRALADYLEEPLRLMV